MLSNNRLGLVLAVLAGVGAIGVGAAMGKGAPGDPLRCEIRTIQDRGFILLEGRVIAPQAARGLYAFLVAENGAGSAEIRHSGAFEAPANEPVTLATVALGKAAFDSRLEVVSGGRTIRCAERSDG